jgi:AcrR family transcriptional regulator
MKEKTPRVKTPKTISYHHGDLGASLVETALRLLKTKRYENISLREVAREAGVSQAAPYRHFKDKKDLLAAVIELGLDRKFRLMTEAIRAAGGDAEKIYFSSCIAYFRMGLKHPEHFKLMFRSEVREDTEHPALLEKNSRLFVLLREVILYCQKKKVIGEGDPYQKAMNCWCVINGFTSLYADGRLKFLGVTEDNAEQALCSLASQFLIGQVEPMSKSDYGFKIFQTPESEAMKNLVLSKSHPEIDEIFSQLT